MAKRQTEIPGTERKTIKELDAAAEGYADARDRRMKATEKEVDAKAALVGAMRKHGLEVYRDETHAPPLLVILKPGVDSVKVTAVDGVDGDDGGEAGE